MAVTSISILILQRYNNKAVCFLQRKRIPIVTYLREAPKRPERERCTTSVQRNLSAMVVTGLLCTISVIVSNVSCLALYSFFASILPTKRNLLTRLNTVLVLAITVLVNTQVRFDSKMCKVSEVFL